jgi:taurine dioxygenase
MEITPLSGALGAEITGIDLTRATDPELKELEQAFLDYLVLAIRDQQLTPVDLLALTESLGGLGETPYLKGMEDYPDIVPVIKEAEEKSPHTFGAGWHTDFTFQQHPPSRTLLYAVETPAVGGDTLYCNLYKSYAALSAGLKTALGSINAIHSATRSYGPSATLKDHMEAMTITNDTREPELMVHPVISCHPDTAKPVLWVNPTYTIRFEDMSEAESAPLLNYLNNLAVNPGFCCRVKWQPGTLTMWDNRCTQHCATSDYEGHRREMWRTTIAGDAPVSYSSMSTSL